MDNAKHVIIYTDGACIGNPGPGGYGVVMRFGRHRRELSAGYRKTTNNRMEILAAIQGLRALKERCIVQLISDSEYLVRMMREGWPSRWQANGWRRSNNANVLNTDLWSELLLLYAQHTVTFEWVKGHAGDVENERCDQLAIQAARQDSAELLIDAYYEKITNLTGTQTLSGENSC